MLREPKEIIQMEIHIKEQPKPKDFFEKNIANITREHGKIPWFVWGFVAIVLGVLSAALIGVTVLSFLAKDVDSIIGNGLTSIIFVSVFFMHGITNKERLDISFNAEIKSLSEAAPEICLKIEKWLENEDIKSFIHKVVTLESRKLRNCEVDSMKVFFEQSLADKENSERQGKIDAACEKIYIAPLVNPA